MPIQTFDGPITLSSDQEDAVIESLSAIFNKAIGYELPILSVPEQRKVITALMAHTADSMERFKNELVGVRLFAFMAGGIAQ